MHACEYVDPRVVIFLYTLKHEKHHACEYVDPRVVIFLHTLNQGIITLRNGTERNIPWHYFPERNNLLCYTMYANSVMDCFSTRTS